MADLAINDCTYVSGPKRFAIAGETLTKGEPIWFDFDDELKAWSCDSSALDSSMAAGICLTDASADDDISYAGDGAEVQFGFSSGAMTAGEFYGVSATAGGIAPLSDLTTSEYMTKMFVARSTTNAVVNILATGRKHAADSTGDLTRTVADVGLILGPVSAGIAVSPITTGWPLYLLGDGTTNSEVYATDASALATAGVIGIALNGPATGPVYYARDGAIVDLGSTLTAGQIYVISTTTNAIMPFSDLGTGDIIGVLGGSISTRHLLIKTDIQGLIAA